MLNYYAASGSGLEFPGGVSGSLTASGMGFWSAVVYFGGNLSPMGRYACVRSRAGGRAVGWVGGPAAVGLNHSKRVTGDTQTETVK